MQWLNLNNKRLQKSWTGDRIVSMTLLDKKITELEQIAEGLRQTIKRNPMHSRIEQVELEDTEQIIRERRSGKLPEPQNNEIVH